MCFRVIRMCRSVCVTGFCRAAAFGTVFGKTSMHLCYCLPIYIITHQDFGEKCTITVISILCMQLFTQTTREAALLYWICTFRWPNDRFVICALHQVSVLYSLSWERSQVDRLLTTCLRQSQLIISLMIWALDMCPGQMRAGKCTHSAVCINLPFQLGLRGNRGREVGEL